MKGVSRAEEEVKPRPVAAPTPKEVSDPKDEDAKDRIEREEVRGERDEKIGFCDHDMPPFGGDLEFFDLASEKPCPNGMGQFVAKDVNPHGFREQQKNSQPASGPANERNPNSFGRAGGAHHPQQGWNSPDTNGQEHEGDKQFNPFGHRIILWSSEAGHNTRL